MPSFPSRVFAVAAAATLVQWGGQCADTPETLGPTPAPSTPAPAVVSDVTCLAHLEATHDAFKACAEPLMIPESESFPALTCEGRLVSEYEKRACRWGEMIGFVTYITAFKDNCKASADVTVKGKADADVERASYNQAQDTLCLPKPQVYWQCVRELQTPVQPPAAVITDDTCKCIYSAGENLTRAVTTPTTMCSQVVMNISDIIGSNYSPHSDNCTAAAATCYPAVSATTSVPTNASIAFVVIVTQPSVPNPFEVLRVALATAVALAPIQVSILKQPELEGKVVFRYVNVDVAIADTIKDRLTATLADNSSHLRSDFRAAGFTEELLVTREPQIVVEEKETVPTWAIALVILFGVMIVILLGALLVLCMRDGDANADEVDDEEDEEMEDEGTVAKALPGDEETPGQTQAGG